MLASDSDRGQKLFLFISVIDPSCKWELNVIIIFFMSNKGHNCREKCLRSSINVCLLTQLGLFFMYARTFWVKIERKHLYRHPFNIEEKLKLIHYYFTLVWENFKFLCQYNFVVHVERLLVHLLFIRHHTRVLLERYI